MQIPHEFLQSGGARSWASLCPSRASTASEWCSCRAIADSRRRCEELIEAAVARTGQKVLGWRDVPTDNSQIGNSAQRRSSRCSGRSSSAAAPTSRIATNFERKLYLIRKRAENAVALRTSRTATTSTCRACRQHAHLQRHAVGRSDRHVFPGSCESAIESALAVVHQRFSTNTFPSWPLAHPFRYISHNGEINTLRGNINWMKARERQFESEILRRGRQGSAAGI